MNRLRLLAFAFLLLALGAPLPAPAQGLEGFDPAALDKMAESVRQVPLTEDMINRFVASYTEMRAVGGKFPVTEPTEEAAAAAGSDLDALSPEKRKAMEEVATKHGFKDLEEWTTVASSIVMSYAYVKEGKRVGELDKMVDQLVAQAQNDPKLTEEQKQQAIAQYRDIGAKLARFQPLPENYDLVAKMIDKVTPIMKIE